MLVEEDEKIVSVGETEQVLLWDKRSGRWTAESLQLERIEVQSMQPNVTRLFIGSNDTKTLFLTKSELIWKVEVFCLPDIFIISDQIADQNIIVGLFDQKSRRWNGYQIDESELINFEVGNVAVSCGVRPVD